MTEEHFYSRGVSTSRKATDHRGSFYRMMEHVNRNPSSGSALRIENGTSTEGVQAEGFTAEDAINRAGVGRFQVKLILLSGFVWMSKGFDTVIRMFISSLTSCDWELLRWHSALMVTITTVAMILGCITYGIWSDLYGRRTALTSALIFVFVFGAVSVGLPNYTWFLIFRTLKSFSVGGLSQALTLCVEFIRVRRRGRVIFILSCFWAVGVIVMLGVLYSMTRPDHYNWRLFAAVSTIPSCVAMIMMRFFPESIRFLLVSDEYVSARNITEEMAYTNHKNLPRGQLYPVTQLQKRGRICQLFSMDYIRSTLLFWYMGLTTAIAYYSLDEMSPYLLGDLADDRAPNSTTSNFMGDMFKPVQCLQNVTEDQFVKIMWTNALDFPGFIIFLLLVDVIDRKPLLCLSCLLSSLFIFLLFIETSNITMLASFLFVARTLLLGQMDMLILMTAEAFPTTVRGTAVGIETATLYIGLFLTPYISKGFLSLHLRYLAGFCGVITFLSAIASALLTWETRGLELMDSIPGS